MAAALDREDILAGTPESQAASESLKMNRLLSSV
jgi:hypothetical protein